MKNIQIKYFTDEIEKLTYIDGKSDWIDLRAAKEMELKAGQYAMIPLGVAMKLPEGYEAHIVPRSSTYKNYGLIQTNHMGVVDESYCGDNDQWHMPVFCLKGMDLKEKGTWIRKGDKIGQFRIMEVMPEIEFEEVESFGNADRGGFGTTGKR